MSRKVSTNNSMKFVPISAGGKSLSVGPYQLPLSVPVKGGGKGVCLHIDPMTYDHG